MKRFFIAQLYDHWALTVFITLSFLFASKSRERERERLKNEINKTITELWIRQGKSRDFHDN